MGHGLGGIKEMRLDAYAERFADAGYACLVFDYRHFGESDGNPRQLLDINQQLEDWRSAIAYTRQQKDINPDQIILWGTSFGGGHVITTASMTPCVAAALVQCPFTDGIASVLAMNVLSCVKVTILGLWDLLRSFLGMAPVMVPTVGAPGSAALMTAPDAMKGYLALVPRGTTFQNYVAARIALNVIRYRPGRRTKEVSCPILFCICETDSVAPAARSVELAKLAPHGETLLYPEGHFDIYFGASFERVIADQLEFLHRHLPTQRKPIHTVASE